MNRQVTNELEQVQALMRRLQDDLETDRPGMFTCVQIMEAMARLMTSLASERRV